MIVDAAMEVLSVPQNHESAEIALKDEIQKITDRLEHIEGEKIKNKTVSVIWDILKFAIPVVLALVALANGRKLDARNDVIEVERRLAEAWDLLGGRPGTDTITKFNKDTYAHELARRKIEEAIRIKPDYGKSHRHLSCYYQAKEKFDLALLKANEAVQLDPQDAVAYFHRGVCHYYLESYEKALADYNEAIRLDPQYPVAYYNRGFCYYYLESYERALADYDEAIRLDPHDAMAYSNRGSCFFVLGNYEKAIVDFEMTLELVKSNPDDKQLVKNAELLLRRSRTVLEKK